MAGSRDDRDALRGKAEILERELDDTKHAIAQREAEMARLRRFGSGPPPPPETPRIPLTEEQRAKRFGALFGLGFGVVLLVFIAVMLKLLKPEPLPPLHRAAPPSGAPTPR